MTTTERSRATERAREQPQLVVHRGAAPVEGAGRLAVGAGRGIREPPRVEQRRRAAACSARRRPARRRSRRCRTRVPSAPAGVRMRTVSSRSGRVEAVFGDVAVEDAAHERRADRRRASARRSASPPGTARRPRRDRGSPARRAVRDRARARTTAARRPLRSHAVHSSSCAVAPRSQLVAQHAERAGERGGAPRLARVDQVELERLLHRRHAAARARSARRVRASAPEPARSARGAAPSAAAAARSGRGGRTVPSSASGDVLERPLVARRQLDEPQQIAHRRERAERPPRAARARRHLARGELRLERRDLTGVVGDHGARRAHGDAVVHVALAQQPRDRVELLGGRAQRECAHRAVGLPRPTAPCGARRRRRRRCAASPGARDRSATRVPRCAASSTDTPPRLAARRAKFSGVAPRNAPEPTSGSPNASTAMPRARRTPRAARRRRGSAPARRRRGRPRCRSSAVDARRCGAQQLRRPRARVPRHPGARRACRRAPRGTRRRTTPAPPSTGIACALAERAQRARARCPSVVHSARNVRTSVRKPFVPRMAGAEPLRPAAAAVGLVLGVAVEQVLDELILVAAGEQLRRLGARQRTAAARTSWKANDATDRASGPGRRAADREREPVAQRRRRLPRRGQHEDRVGVDARARRAPRPARRASSSCRCPGRRPRHRMPRRAAPTTARCALVQRERRAGSAPRTSMASTLARRGRHRRAFAESVQRRGRGPLAGVVELPCAPGHPGARRPRDQPARREACHVEIRIGIANTGRELNFETSEPAAAVKKSIASALDAGATHVSFTDSKGNSLHRPDRDASPTSSWAPKSPVASASSPDRTRRADPHRPHHRRRRSASASTSSCAQPRHARRRRSARSSARSSAGLVVDDPHLGGRRHRQPVAVAVGVRRADRGDLPGRCILLTRARVAHDARERARLKIG